MSLEATADHGLTGPWQPLHRDNQVHVHRADDDDSTAAGLARLRAAFAERESETAEAAEVEAEMQEYRAAAIQQLHERIEKIRIESWSRPWTPDADDEGGFND